MFPQYVGWQVWHWLIFKTAHLPSTRGGLVESWLLRRWGMHLQTLLLTAWEKQNSVGYVLTFTQTGKALALQEMVVSCNPGARCWHRAHREPTWVLNSIFKQARGFLMPYIQRYSLELGDAWQRQKLLVKTFFHRIWLLKHKLKSQRLKKEYFLMCRVYVHLGRSLRKVVTLTICSYTDLCFKSFISCFVQHQTHQHNPPRSLSYFCCRHLIALLGAFVGLLVLDSV